VAKHLAGTVDNADGYQDMKIAEKQGRRFAALLRAGHKSYFDSIFERHLLITFQVFQETKGEPIQHCSPRFDWPATFQGCEWAMELVRRVGRRIEKQKRPEYPRDLGDYTFKDHAAVLAALEAMGATRVVRFTPDVGDEFPQTFMVEPLPEAEQVATYSLV
jgi:hypothetical protein